MDSSKPPYDFFMSKCLENVENHSFNYAGTCYRIKLN